MHSGRSMNCDRGDGFHRGHARSCSPSSPLAVFPPSAMGIAVQSVAEVVNGRGGRELLGMATPSTEDRRKIFADRTAHLRIMSCCGTGLRAQATSPPRTTGGSSRIEPGMGLRRTVPGFLQDRHVARRVPVLLSWTSGGVLTPSACRPAFLRPTPPTWPLARPAGPKREKVELTRPPPPQRHPLHS